MSSIHDSRYQSLIKKLIHIRKLKNITQVELASSLKKPQSYVAKVENFDRRIDVIELNDWLIILDVSIINFLKDSL